MAGGMQAGFGFPKTVLKSRLRPGEIVVDLFAGGGGASTALEQALGRPVDIAINHNPIALAMHAANHPFTRHMAEDVWEADPRALVAGRALGWLHASPDCTHFSQAKGGQPRSRATRSLSWVVLRWAGTVCPRIISMENVWQILQWGPLIAKRDKATGRCLKAVTREVTFPTHKKGKLITKTVTTYEVAAPGECVPLAQQFLIPDKRHAGRTWRAFVGALRAMGYVVEWRKLKACDHGAGTSRERLFLVARRDGQPIVWPEPSHGPGRAEPYVTAADCIDWSIPCPSIFTRKKPLADATLRRIARGVQRYVIDAAEPFIVPATHHGSDRCNATSDPLPTITAANRGELMAVSPVVVQCSNASANGIADAAQPLGTVTSWPRGGSHAVVAPTLVQAGYGEREGQAPRALDIGQPLGVVVAGGVKHALAAAHLVKFRGNHIGDSVEQPLPTITSGANAARPAGAAHAMGVMTAYLEQAAGGPNSNGSRPRGCDEPVSTITQAGSQQQLVTAILAGVGGRAGDTEPRPVDQPGYTITAKADCAVVAANMVTLRGDNTGAGADEPVRTLSAGGEHHAVVECTLSPEQAEGALRVAALLLRYHSTGGQDGSLADPLTTITTKDRLALVTVTIKGTPYVIVDIGLRMLKPHELYRAQDFPPDYVIDRTACGKPMTISQAVAMVGNSVSPPPMRAIAAANLDSVEDLLEAA